MSAMQPQVMVPGSKSSNTLKVTMTIFSAIGLAIWGTSMGVTLGYNFYLYVPPQIVVGSSFTVVINAAMIYVACRLIFVVMDRSFPNALSLQDLQQSVARMVALTVIGFSVWVTSVVWLTMYGVDLDYFIVFHASTYGFIPSMVVAGLAGNLLDGSTKRSALPVQAVAPKYNMPQTQAHYNQAYMHYGHHRV